MIAQHFAVRSNCLLQDFLPMSNEEQARPPRALAAGAIVERRDNGLSRAGCGDYQVAIPPMLPLGCELIEHLALVILGRDVKERRARRDVISGLSSQRARQ